MCGTYWYDMNGYGRCTYDENELLLATSADTTTYCTYGHGTYDRGMHVWARMGMARMGTACIFYAIILVMYVPM